MSSSDQGDYFGVSAITEAMTDEPQTPKSFQPPKPPTPKTSNMGKKPIGKKKDLNNNVVGSPDAVFGDADTSTDEDSTNQSQGRTPGSGNIGTFPSTQEGGHGFGESVHFGESPPGLEQTVNFIQVSTMRGSGSEGSPSGSASPTALTKKMSLMETPSSPPLQWEDRTPDTSSSPKIKQTHVNVNEPFVQVQQDRRHQEQQQQDAAAEAMKRHDTAAYRTNGQRRPGGSKQATPHSETSSTSSASKKLTPTDPHPRGQHVRGNQRDHHSPPMEIIDRPPQSSNPPLRGMVHARTTSGDLHNLESSTSSSIGGRRQQYASTADGTRRYNDVLHQETPGGGRRKLTGINLEPTYLEANTTHPRNTPWERARKLSQGTQNRPPSPMVGGRARNSTGLSMENLNQLGNSSENFRTSPTHQRPPSPGAQNHSFGSGPYPSGGYAHSAAASAISTVRLRRKMAHGIGGAAPMELPESPQATGGPDNMFDRAIKSFAPVSKSSKRNEQAKAKAKEQTPQGSQQSGTNPSGGRHGSKGRGYKNHRDDSNPLQMIPWDQRATIPKGAGAHMCAMCTAPNFWQRMEWAIRCTLFAVVPPSALSLAGTRSYFVAPGILAEVAFWISSATLGDALREFAYLLKGYFFAFICMCIMIGSQPENQWLWLFLFWLFSFILAAMTEDSRRPATFLLAVSMVTYWWDPTSRNFEWLGKFFRDIGIGLAFGVFALIFPRPTWALSIAKDHCSNLGNVASVSIQGIIYSMWCQPMERELHLVKIEQLRLTMVGAVASINKRLAEAEFEPHNGLTLAEVRYLKTFLEGLVNVVHSAASVITVINENPALLESGSAKLLGELIEQPLTLFATAIDSTLLKIADRNLLVDEADINQFMAARELFQQELMDVREQVLTSPDFDPTEVDALIGYFFFSLDEIAMLIAGYKPPTEAPSHAFEFFTAPCRDFAVTVENYKKNFRQCLKDGFKLSLAMTLTALLQLFIDDTSAASGAAIVAFVSNSNQASTFNYSMGRLLGTVVGSVISYLLVSNQYCDGDFGVVMLVVGIAICTFIGCFIQSSRQHYAVGNALVFSTISIVSGCQTTGVAAATAVASASSSASLASVGSMGSNVTSSSVSGSFTSSSASASTSLVGAAVAASSGNSALNRIQQNVIAILLYFVISSVIWPVRANDAVRDALMGSLREFRKTMGYMMDSLGEKDSAKEVFIETGEMISRWRKLNQAQADLIPGAVVEPTMAGSDFPEQEFRAVLHAEENILSLVAMLRYAHSTFMRSVSGEDSIHWRLLNEMCDDCVEFSDVVYAIADLHLLSIGRTTVVPTSHLVRLRVSLIRISRNIVERFTDSFHREMVQALSAAEEQMEGSQEEFGNSWVETGSAVGPQLPPKRSKSPHPTLPTVDELSSEVMESLGRGRISGSRRQVSPACNRKRTFYRGPHTAVDMTTTDEEMGQVNQGSTTTDNEDGAGSTTSVDPGNDTTLPLASNAGSDASRKEKSGGEEAEEITLSNEDLHSMEAWVFGIQAITTEMGVLQRALLRMHHAEELDEVF